MNSCKHDPEISRRLFAQSSDHGLIEGIVLAESTHAMFLIEALHSEGWQQEGTASLEYWAYQHAQTRCCADGRNYRIRSEETGRIISIVNPISCRARRAL